MRWNIPALPLPGASGTGSCADAAGAAARPAGAGAGRLHHTGCSRGCGTGVFPGAGAAGCLCAGCPAHRGRCCSACRAMLPPSAAPGCCAGTWCWRPLPQPFARQPCWAFRCGGPGGVWRGCWVLRCALPGNGCCGRWLCGTRRAAQHAKNAGTQKEPQKIRKRTCQTSAVCCIIQTYQSKRRDAVCLLRRWGRVQWQIRAAKRAGSVRLAKR